MFRVAYETDSTFRESMYGTAVLSDRAVMSPDLAPLPEPPRIAPVLTIRQPVLVADLTSQSGAATSVPLPARGDTVERLPDSLTAGRVAGPQPTAASSTDAWRYGVARDASAQQLATLNLAPSILSRSTPYATGRVAAPTLYSERTPPAIVAPGKLHQIGADPAPVNGTPASQFPAWLPAALGALALFAI